MRIIACVSVIVLLAFSAPPSSSVERSTAPINDGETITIRLLSFAFDPEHLRLKAAVPLRLRLVNESNGGHDFSAPALFAASRFPPGSSPPLNGKVAVGSNQTVEIAVVPRTPGIYRVECTHFLHSLFGMHGTVEVMP
jgi:plastocyanin